MFRPPIVLPHGEDNHFYPLPRKMGWQLDRHRTSYHILYAPNSDHDLLLFHICWQRHQRLLGLL